MKSMFKLFGTGVLAVALLAACNDGNEEQSSSGQDQIPTERTDPETDEQGGVTTIEPGQLGATFVAGAFEDIYAQTSAEFKQQVPKDQFIQTAQAFNEGVTEYHLLSMMTIQGMLEYLWVDQSGTKGIMSYFDQDQTITGLRILPLTTYPETDEVLTETVFIVPTTETWFTFWGGRNEMLNYHYAVENQRYAYDWVIMKDGFSYEGEPTENESYYAWGKDVVAPAGGTVLAVENDIPDNKPLVETNTEQPLGNHVIIDHGNGEYSVLAHFQQGSVVVAEGDTVEQGDLLGLCGNSGNSSEPHIHFHVMDGPDWTNAASIRVQFEGGLDPIRGDWVPAGTS